MIIQLQGHPLFSAWRDPVTGIRSFLLKNRPALIVQNFYFLENAWTRDGRFLWFYCVFPPSGRAQYGRLLGNVDFRFCTVQVFPETSFGDASPLLDDVTGEIYWVSETGIYRRGPEKADQVQLVAQMPPEIIRDRVPFRIATHLTFSADHRHLNVDAQIGRDWYIGDVEIASGRFTLWQHFRDICFSLRQFSPTDNDLQLIAQDWWHDCVTGEGTFFDNRMWRLGEEAKPIYLGHHDEYCHEWWSSDGQKVLYVDYDQGTFAYTLQSGETECIWPGKPCHSHASKDLRYLTGDVNDYTWDTDPCKVLFYDAARRREIAIVSDMAKPAFPRSRYHTDPHPCFTREDSFIQYTSTELGMFTLALTPVSEILVAPDEYWQDV